MAGCKEMVESIRDWGYNWGNDWVFCTIRVILLFSRDQQTGTALNEVWKPRGYIQINSGLTLQIFKYFWFLHGLFKNPSGLYVQNYSITVWNIW